jgi:hypothetical protein
MGRTRRGGIRTRTGEGGKRATIVLACPSIKGRACVCLKRRLGCALESGYEGGRVGAHSRTFTFPGVLVGGKAIKGKIKFKKKGIKIFGEGKTGGPRDDILHQSKAWAGASRRRRPSCASLISQPTILYFYRVQLFKIQSKTNFPAPIGHNLRSPLVNLNSIILASNRSRVLAQWLMPTFMQL